MLISFNPSCRIDSLSTTGEPGPRMDVLRLDLLHPVVSGNKWFKLQGYLREAKRHNKALLTFGGAYSNHIVATAAAAKNEGLKSIGIIRGERAPAPSHTLQKAGELGMMLFFTSRTEYREKKVPAEVWQQFRETEVLTIPEGGYGTEGAIGAMDILLQNETSAYSHIITATGTGTTLAGLVMAALTEQTIIGIPVLKNHFSLKSEIRHLLPLDKKDSFELVEGYHFGGYAKYDASLLRFMNDFYRRTGIPTDFVYTAKAFAATFDLLQKGRFSATDRILIIHTGGLQGNLSLPKGTLIFG